MMTGMAGKIGKYGANSAFSALGFLIAAITITQLYSLVYRFTVLLDNELISKTIVRRGYLGVFFAVLMGFCSMFAWTVYTAFEDPGV